MSIVIWPVKHAIIAEPSVPCEENREEAFERKKFRYENLLMYCRDKGWLVEWCTSSLFTVTSSVEPDTQLGQNQQEPKQKEPGPLSSFSQHKIGLPVGSGPKSKRHIITKSPSFLSLLLCSTPIQLPTPPFPLHPFRAACCIYLMITR